MINIKSIVIAALLSILAVSQANAVLSVEDGASCSTGSAGTGFSCSGGGGVSGTAGDIVISEIACNASNSRGAFPTISGVSDSSGLGHVWVARGPTGGHTYHNGTNVYVVHAIYWTYASTTFATTLSVTTNNTYDACSEVSYAVKGFTGTLYQTSPWDSNGSLPSVANIPNGSARTVTGISTTSVNAMLTAFGQGSNGCTWINSYTQIAAGPNGNGAIAADLVVSSTQSNVSAGCNTTVGQDAIMIGDALAQGGGSAPPSLLLILGVGGPDGN